MQLNPGSHYSSWTTPLLLAIALLTIGRVFLPAQETPADLMKNVRTLSENKDWAGALTEIKKLLVQFPTNHIYLHQAASLATQNQTHAEAASYLEKFWLVSPNPDEACPEISHAYWKAGNLEKMLESATRCANFSPKNSDFKFEHALSLERSDQLEAALEQYRSGIELFPGYGDFQIGHARILLRLGRADEAWREISVYRQAQPAVADAELVAGLAAQRTNQTTEALAILEQAVREHPNNSELRDAYNKLLENGSRQ